MIYRISCLADVVSCKRYYLLDECLCLCRCDLLFVDGNKSIIIPPANYVCGRVYCFHVVRPYDRVCVRNVLFP